jgi:putative ABC transport system permease protein
MLHKTRALLTMLGVVFGVGSVIAMLSVGEGASRDALNEIRKLGSNNIIIQSAKAAENEQQGSTRRYMSIYGLLYQDQIRIEEGIPDVVRTVPAKIFTKDARLGPRNLELRMVGTTPAWFDVVPRKLIAGRVFNNEDMLSGSPVVVLTEYSARQLTAGNYTLGQNIVIGGIVFKLIGIIQSDGGASGNIQTPDQPRDAYIPLTTTKSRFGDIFTRRTAGTFEREYVELHQLIIEVSDISHVEPTADAIRYMLEHFHEHEDYELKVPLALLKQAEKTKRTFNIVLGAIACISLLVGGIGIMNIMLASVTERTREIGIRRAVGAQRKHIIQQFLVETMVLSTVGGLIGIGLGLFIPWMITLIAGMPTVVTPWSVALSLGISVGIGIVFGLYPAVRAANLDPIDALRHE